MFRKPEKFNPVSDPNPSTPSSRASAVWDDRLGTSTIQAYNWRRIALGLLVANIILTGGITMQSLKTRVIPYVVTVDKTTGQVEKAGAFTGNGGNYTPQEAEIKYFIAKFVQNARNIGLDPVAYNKSQLQAAYFLTNNAAQKYSLILESNDIRNKIGKITVTTHIVSIQKVPDSESSYQVRWTEEEVGIQNGRKSEVPMSGIFSFTILPVKDEEQRLNNPLGLFISDFNFSKDASAVNDSAKIKNKG